MRRPLGENACDPPMRARGPLDWPPTNLTRHPNRSCGPRIAKSTARPISSSQFARYFILECIRPTS
jgi:hypothetical protein